MRNFLCWISLLCLLSACSVVSASALEPTAPAPTATLSGELLDPIPDFTVAPAQQPTRTPSPSPTITSHPSTTGTPSPTRIVRTATPTLTPDYWATRVSLGREVRVPILMYHHIAIPPERADAIRLDLSVWPERFDEQLAFLARRGFHSVRLADVYDAVTKETPLPSNPIVLTFDDGYDDNYLNALPILQKHNFIGTFYIPTGLLERPGYMTWEQVIALSNGGMDVQSHSVSHPSLKGQTVGFLRKELGDSKRALEAKLGKPVNFFCYPGGQYDALTIQTLQELGYLSATTTRPGARQYQGAPYQWPRVRVRGSDQLSDFAVRLYTSLGGR